MRLLNKLKRITIENDPESLEMNAKNIYAALQEKMLEAANNGEDDISTTLIELDVPVTKRVEGTVRLL